MWVSYFEKVQKSLIKYFGKVIQNDTIRELLEKHLGSDSYTDAKMYKMIYQLKVRGYLLNLKKNLFYVVNPQKTPNLEKVITEVYWDLLKKHCGDFIGKRRYIGGLKALEIAVMDYGIPDEILLVNSQKQGSETIVQEKKALLKTYTSKDKSQFSFFFKWTRKVVIGKHRFDVAIPELAVLETLYNASPLQKSYAEEQIKRWLKKNKKYLNYEFFEELLKLGKHNSSMNRIALLFDAIDSEWAKKIKNLIKKYGYLLY